MNTSGENILTVVKKEDRIVKVDLSPFNIFTKSDFIISLELLKVYGEEDLGLILSATLNGYGSYRKYASQDKWEWLSDLNMAYYVKSQLMVSEKFANRFEKRQQKINQKKRTVSGFVILRGKMISGVSVFNNTTKESVLSGDGGRYLIPAKKGDILTFSKKGLENFNVKITDKPTRNVSMSRK